MLYKFMYNTYYLHLYKLVYKNDFKNIGFINTFGIIFIYYCEYIIYL